MLKKMLFSSLIILVILLRFYSLYINFGVETIQVD